MNATVEIDKKSQRQAERILEDFAKRAGIHVDDVINGMARSSAKNMAISVQPFGLKATTGKKFAGSIAKQVSRAIRNANVTGRGGSAEDVHKSVRDSRGRVSRDLETSGQYKRKPVDFSERDALIKKQIGKSGRAKGAWIEAGDKVTGKKTTGVASWISRHRKEGYGDARKSGDGINYAVEISNKTPYIRKFQPQEMIDQSVEKGVASEMRRLERLIKKEIEKANRA